ncbi:MAG: DNA polymerase III subunit delta [Candidatus Symbiothrix sp.]|jgi:DNA polymerase-3 subunit delta|nr:DNA polymerase III subunit delta [Candidatus Symbiothrix sp.]
MAVKSFDEIKREVKAKQFAPVYLFQGEEGYYIDQLTDLVLENALEEHERDFNQTIFYGIDSDVNAIIDACRRYPMMAERQLVVVREAQNLKNIDELLHYVTNPLPSTVLVLNHKHKKLDMRKKLGTTITKSGVAFESKKIYDNQVPAFIINYLKDKKISIDAQSAQILTDYLGAGLSKIVNELDKLAISLPADNRQITPEIIEKNIGISKDFNNFELQKAIANLDVVKANRIARYFEENQKNNPLVMTLSLLFGFFTNLMICHYEKDKSTNSLKQALGVQWDIQVIDYQFAMKHYNAVKTMRNVALIREYDAKSKGFQNSLTPTEKLLPELLFKLMH